MFARPLEIARSGGQPSRPPGRVLVTRFGGSDRPSPDDVRPADAGEPQADRSRSAVPNVHLGHVLGLL